MRNRLTGRRVFFAIACGDAFVTMAVLSLGEGRFEACPHPKLGGCRKWRACDWNNNNYGIPATPVHRIKGTQHTHTHTQWFPGFSYLCFRDLCFSVDVSGVEDGILMWVRTEIECTIVTRTEFLLLHLNLIQHYWLRAGVIYVRMASHQGRKKFLFWKRTIKYCSYYIRCWDIFSLVHIVHIAKNVYCVERHGLMWAFGRKAVDDRV